MVINKILHNDIYNKLTFRLGIKKFLRNYFGIYDTKHYDDSEDEALRNTLAGIENILENQRGYVFKMPPRGSKVMVLFSGGLDSAVVTGILLEKYGYTVYPVHFIRKWPGDTPKPTLDAAKKIHAFFRKKYPGKIMDLEVLSFNFPPPEIVKISLKIAPTRDKRTGKIHGTPFDYCLMVYDCIHLLRKYNKKVRESIRTIFMATIASDAQTFAYQNIVSFRSLMLEVCVMMRDFSWQITSLPVEKREGFYLKKEDLIKIGIEQKIPLANTRTCRRPGKYHCGKCVLCKARQEGFRNAGIKDPTRYQNI